MTHTHVSQSIPLSNITTNKNTISTTFHQALDPALLRPGRLSHVIEVTPPQTTEERLAVLRIHTRKVG